MLDLDAEADRLRLADAEQRGVNTERLLAFHLLTFQEMNRWRTAARAEAQDLPQPELRAPVRTADAADHPLPDL